MTGDPLPTPEAVMHRFLPLSAVRALAAGLCLAVCLTLSACIINRGSTRSEGPAEPG